MFPNIKLRAMNFALMLSLITSCAGKEVDSSPLDAPMGNVGGRPAAALGGRGSGGTSGGHAGAAGPANMGGNDGPTVSTGGASGTGGGGTGGTGSCPNPEGVRFDRVYELFQRRCENCHSSLGQFGSEQGAYDWFKDSPQSSLDCPSGIPIAQGCRAEESTLLRRLSATSNCGPRMPDGCSTESGAAKPCLTLPELSLVRQWIADGALR